MAVFGVGIYVPYNGYTCRKDNKITREYSVWADMFCRCYGGYYHTYKGCVVEEVWHRSDNFWMWAENQIGFAETGYYLDKDILVRGNKSYGPLTCAFVPRDLNQFLCGAEAIRGKYPQGITYSIDREKYHAKISINNKTVNLGRYDSISSAMAAYAAAKTEEGHRWAERLKSGEFNVDQRVIDTMESYEFVYEGHS